MILPLGPSTLSGVSGVGHLAAIAQMRHMQRCCRNHCFTFLPQICRFSAAD